MNQNQLKDILSEIYNNPDEYITNITHDQIYCSVDNHNFIIYCGCAGSCMGIQSSGVVWEIDLTPDIKQEYIDYFDKIQNNYKDKYFKNLYDSIVKC
jgi:hypothetical protein